VRLYYQTIGGGTVPVNQIHAYYPKIVVAPQKVTNGVLTCGSVGGPR